MAILKLIESAITGKQQITKLFISNGKLGFTVLGECANSLR